MALPSKAVMPVSDVASDDDDDAVDVVDDVTEHSDKELALRFSW